MNGIVVEQFTNIPVSSNCYIVHAAGRNDCILIDPGSKDSGSLMDYLNRTGLLPRYIFLTHEHFDHIWSVNCLKEVYNADIICSSLCSDRIADKKKNMSVFYDQEGFACVPCNIPADTSMREYIYSGLPVKFIETSGHTEASICILIANNLFTGDTIIPGSKTVVKFPSGNKMNLEKSLKSLFSMFQGKNITVYPGHGNSVNFDLLKPEDMLS